MQRYRAIIKRPDEKYGHVTNISTSLENLQNIVGGPIEVVRLMDDHVLIVNERGKLKGLQQNFKIPGDIIVGEAVVLGVKGEEFTDATIDWKVWRWLLEIWGNVV